MLRAIGPMEAPLLLLNNDDVSKVLNMTMCIEAIEGVFDELAVGDAAHMGRIDLYVPSGQETPYYRWAVMTGGSKKDGYVCARMLSDMVNWPVQHGQARETKYAQQPGTFCGLLFLFSVRDGTPVAMINDGVLQHTRVGGGAGLGVKLLSREDSQTVGMIGSGGVARTYLEAFMKVRDVRKVKVYSPNTGNARLYAEEMRALHGIEVEPVESAREAAQGVDIVSCCTSSIEPVFFKEWLEPGMHLTDLNGEEVHPDAKAAIDVFVRAGEHTAYLKEQVPGSFHASHGFLAYVAGSEEEKSVVPRKPPRPEVLEKPPVVDVITGKAAGRTNDLQTSYFANAGAIGAQFEAVAAAVYEKAREMGIGTEIPTEWFLQDVRD